MMRIVCWIGMFLWGVSVDAHADAHAHAHVEAATQPGSHAALPAASATALRSSLQLARQQLDVALDLLKAGEPSGTGGQKMMLGLMLDGGDAADGVRVMGVIPEGGAATAGLETGDVIVSIAGVDLQQAAMPVRALGAVMQELAPGEDVTLEYVRDGQRVQATVVPTAQSMQHIVLIDEGNADPGQLLRHLNIELPGLGEALSETLPNLDALAGHGEQVWVQKSIQSERLMQVSGELAKYFDVRSGILVIDVPAGAEVRPGDILLSIDGVDLDSVEQALTTLGAVQAPVAARVLRKGRKRSVTIAPGQLVAPAPRVIKKVLRIGPAAAPAAPAAGGQAVEIEVEVAQ